MEKEKATKDKKKKPSKDVEEKKKDKEEKKKEKAAKKKDKKQKTLKFISEALFSENPTESREEFLKANTLD